MTATFDPAEIAKDFEAQAQLTPEEMQKIRLYARDIDLKDALTAAGYGAKEQRDLGDLSDILLKRASGGALEDAVAAIHALKEQLTSLDIASLGTPKGFFASLFSPGKRQYAALRQGYTEITYLIDRLTNQMEMARLALQKEILLLDTLYEKNKACYHALEIKIMTGEQAVAAATQKDTTKDEVVSKSSVSLFSDRLNQLRQSKTISLQLASQIRLVQHNQQLVVDKLKQMTKLALPLWQSQLALALNINRQQEALSTYRKAAKQTADAMDQARQSFKKGSKDAVQKGKNALTELERLKEADFQLKQLLNETLASAHQARISTQDF